MIRSRIKKPERRNSIVFRANTLNTLLLGLVLAAVTIIITAFVTSISRNSARNTARACSLEAAKAFYSYISEDLALVQKASFSRAVTGWCADEGDDAKKLMAFNEMMDYISMRKACLYIGISESLNAYSVAGNIQFEEFSPAMALDPDDHENAWYFNGTRLANNYSLDTGAINSHDNDRRLLISHKIAAGGEPAGVFCACIDFPDVFRKVYSHGDAGQFKVFVIDKNGIVKLAGTDNGDIAEEAEDFIYQAGEGRAIKGVLNAYLGNIGGLFDHDSPPVVVGFPGGLGNYAAIAPIAGTDWSAVVFYENNFLSSVAYLLPLLFVMLFALVLYTVARNVIMDRLIYSPLSSLTRSISEARSGGANFAGCDRDDEIGDLVRTIRDTSLERYRQEQLLYAVNNIASVLLAPVSEDDFEASLLEGMEYIGHNIDVDRITIWRNEAAVNDVFFVLCYEWVNSMYRKIRLDPSSRYSYNDHALWKEKFSKGELLNGPLSQMPPEDQAFLAQFGIVSILLIPVHLEERFWGFVCFEDSRSERTFNSSETGMMRSGSLMMVNAVNRNMQAARLSKANANTQALLDAMPLTTHLWNREGKVLDCNNETVKLFMLDSKQEFIDNFSSLSPEYQPNGQLSSDTVNFYINKAFDEGKCVFEWMHQASDGTPLPMEITLVRITYDDEQIVAGYGRNLSEHKKMMNEIERGDFFLNTVNTAANILIQSVTDEFDYDLLKCMCLMGEAVKADRVSIWKNNVNGSDTYFTQMYEWLGNAMPRSGSSASERQYYDAAACGWVKRLAEGKCINCIMQNMPPLEQSDLMYSGSLSVLILPVFMHGDFWGFIRFDDCRHERTFSENEELVLRSGTIMIANALMRNDMAMNIQDGITKLEAVIANYPGIIWCVDQDNVITLFNGLYLNSLDLFPSHFEGSKIEKFMKEKWFFGIMVSVHETFMEGPQDWQYEFDDKVFRIRTTLIYEDTDSMTSVMGSLDDITERTCMQNELSEALAKAQEASAAKTSFLARMSHEMRTPLNAIIGLSRLTMEAEGIDNEVVINLEKINNAGETLLSTVNDILDISKIEAGKLEILPVEYDFPDLINDAVTQCIMRIGDKNIEFILDIDEHLPTRLYGDDLRIKQVFNNLLSNAFKYTNEGVVKLTLRCERTGDDIMMMMRVSDTGKGIRKESQKNLFSDFNQIDAVSNRTIEGTGLGLPITKRVLEMMGGSIFVESEFGEGSVFTAYIPQRFVSDATIGTTVMNSLKTFTYSSQKWKWHSGMMRISVPYARVLVVDDVATNLDVAKGMLKPYRMTVDYASSGTEAIDAVRDEKVRYNAIFMDHMMPGMDGIEATRIIRGLGTEYAQSVPIIALTANAIVGNEQMFLDKGFQAYISKPIEIGRLDAVINEWVRDRELEKQLEGQEENAQEAAAEAAGGSNSSVLEGKAIEGLDIQKGIERFRGDEESYLGVLHSYAVNTAPLLEKAGAVSMDSLADYAIAVHGVKGSSRGICAEEIGDRAEALEKAAKAGNLEFVLEHNAGFIAAAEGLIRSINAVLDDAESKADKPPKDRPDTELLHRLMKACGNGDIDTVDSVMKELKSYTYESDGGLVAWLGENADAMNYTEMKERLESDIIKDKVL